MNTSNKLELRLCGPRGFCAGVDRAIQMVVLALKKHGAPVYVRHEIVHNRFVVEGLEELGAVFVEELDEISSEYGRERLNDTKLDELRFEHLKKPLRVMLSSNSS